MRPIPFVAALLVLPAACGDTGSTTSDGGSSTSDGSSTGAPTTGTTGDPTDATSSTGVPDTTGGPGSTGGPGTTTGGSTGAGSTGSTGGGSTGETAGVCTQEGCACDGGDESCDPGLACVDSVCTAPLCGDGTREGGEQCDDGNGDDGDGCDADCTYTQILQVEAGQHTTCVLIEGGRVRCWGANSLGQLGYGHTDPVGDDETPAQAGDVMLPEPGVALAMGGAHTCMRLADDGVRCWGANAEGQLGYGNTDKIGDDEFPLSIFDVSIGGATLEVDAGGVHTCARLGNGKMRCWGHGHLGALGYGDKDIIGDDEVPSEAGDVPVGTAVVAQATGSEHTCGILANGAIRCWGRNVAGELGYGHTNAIGDDETPAAAGDVSAIAMGLPPTTKVAALALGNATTCALYDSGEVLCWGSSTFGQLGQGNHLAIGDDELPSSFAPIDLGAKAKAITAGENHVCALLVSDEVLCWGYNVSGQLGQGHTDTIGDDELLVMSEPIVLGAPVQQIEAGGFHTCAVLVNNEVRCWGHNASGQLGLGGTYAVGDDELPIDVAAVDIF